MEQDLDLRSRFVDLHGYWDDALDRAAASDPAFFASYLSMASVALRSGPLDRKTCDFVMIAANASVTHMNRAAVEAHMASAQRNGATRAELREVLQIASVLGIHAYMLGAPILMEEVRKAAHGDPTRCPSMGVRERTIKEEFLMSRRYWSDLLEDMLVASPDFFEAYTRFSSHPWKNGVLAPKTKELLYIAIDVSTTHLHEPGTRIHMQNALRLGARAEEIVQVVQIVSCMGFQSYLLGTPVLPAGGAPDAPGERPAPARSGRQAGRR